MRFRVVGVSLGRPEMATPAPAAAPGAPVAGLSLLHDEVLLRIFEYSADPRTMASLEGVSRSWRSLVRSSPSNMWRRICLSFGFALVGPQPLLQLPPPTPCHPRG